MRTARRAAVRGWLTHYGMTGEAADSWCDAWEAEAASRGLHIETLDFWMDAGPWIAESLRARQLISLIRS